MIEGPRFRMIASTVNARAASSTVPDDVCTVTVCARAPLLSQSKK
jgi:hypothetical protein